MTIARCPGQDSRSWRFTDIFEVPCPRCGLAIEFFKTDIRLPCPGCATTLQNPRLNLGCAAWCAHGPQCLADPDKDKG